jgi:CDP-diacylglycerol--serine O-phosphatidyltransferase
MIFRRRPQNSQEDADIASREDPYNVANASHIYLLPNLMTAGNLLCGFMAVVNCIHARLAASSGDGLYLNSTAGEHYRYAVYFIFGAAVFDLLDGRLARMGGRESLFGAEFDSLADVVSFGMAPAFLMFFLILSPSQAFPWFRLIGGIFGFYYLLMAAMRLARFNVITNPLLHPGKKETNKDFVGLPVPAAAMTVASLVLFLLKLDDADKSLSWYSLALPPLMALIATLMMSGVRYPSGKNLDLQTQTKPRTLGLMVIVLGVVIAFREVAFMGLCLGYILFGLARHWMRVRAGRLLRQVPPA